MKDNTAHAKLPLTYYDRLKNIHPQLAGFIEAAISDIRSRGIDGPVKADDFQEDEESYFSYMKFFVDKFIDDTAAFLGMDRDLIEPDIKRSPQISLIVRSLDLDYWNFINFELAGRKTFFFHDNLTDHLLSTELTVDSSLVKPPFPTCLLMFSARLAIDAAYAAMNHPVSPECYKAPLCVFVTSFDMRDDPESRNIMMFVTHWYDKNPAFAIKREVAIRPNWKLEDALRTDWKELVNHDDLESGMQYRIDGYVQEVADESFYTDGLALFRLILNAILYLSSSDPEIVERLSGRKEALDRASSIKSREKAKKARYEARKESELDYFAVGESVPLIYVRKGDVRDAELPCPNDSREYAVRFIVRGHWRNQACGPGLSERRLVWIKPYYKGPEMADLVNRPYKVI
jgi:hypothetical protein